MDPQDQEPCRVLERSRGPAGLTDAIAFQRRPLETLARLRRRRGPIFPLSSLIAGRMLVIGTPELAHEILHAPAGRYLAGAANHQILPVLPEDTVLTLDGDAHLERRRRLARFFHGDVLRALAPHVREIAGREIETWPLGVPFAVLPRLRFLTLSVAARLILGVEDHRPVAMLERHLRRALRPYAMLAGRPALRHLGAASPQAAAQCGRRAFAQGLSKVLGSATADEDSPARALEEVGSDQLLALLLAGHETTATALAWAIYELARAPQLVERLATERDQPERPGLEALVSETLRLHPPLVDIVRQPTEPVRLDGCQVDAGALLLMPPPLIHQQAPHPDVEKFDPSRFLADHPDPRMWIPFGGGDRRCLGASLALLELREVIPQIAERFVLKPTQPASEHATLYGTALIPSRGGCIVFQRRG